MEDRQDIIDDISCEPEISIEEHQQEEPLNNEIATIDFYGTVGEAVNTVEGKIVEGATKKVNNEKFISKHSKNIAKVSDRAIRVATDEQKLRVERKNAENKVNRQEIKNRLIELKTEALKLKREQKQLLKEQKAEHKKRDKDAQWELYKDKLTKMKYTYVPNKFTLKMLLFFDSIVSFFNGVGAVSTAIMKALKWILLLVAVLLVLLIIPATRQWIFELLGFIG